VNGACTCATCSAIRVTLTAAQERTAKRIAARRYTEDRKAKLSHRFGAPDTVEPDLIGALGEAAFAAHLRLELRKGNLGDYDVAGYQVRTTKGLGRTLILHKSDDDNDVFVLASHVHSRVVYLCGWIRARDGKLSEWWRDPVGGRPAYFVPTYGLKPIGTLPRRSA
jgi:hypothetical protein